MQFDNMIADGSKHAFHLMVAAFADSQAHVRRAQYLQHGGFREIFFVMQLHAFREPLCGILSHWRFQCDPIGFLAVMARGRDTM